MPLGLGQVNQLHDSYSDSPMRKVLLVPSVMSRRPQVPPWRQTTPVQVVPPPNVLERTAGKLGNGQGEVVFEVPVELSPSLAK